ncbi:MAG: DUF4230 domain-containing protein [Bacteroidaceae bacterium]|nr:DUF4230 domain-containing protein [Bacteroidaceae bacterium]
MRRMQDNQIDHPNTWKDRYETLKLFIADHFLALIKVAIVVLCFLMFLAILTGNIKSPSSKKDASSSLLDPHKAPPFVKKIQGMKQINGLIEDREVVVSQFKMLNNTPKPISIHMQVTGTLAIGVNLQKKTRKWIELVADTLILHLPAVEMLTPDPECLDREKERILIQSGSWSGNELNTLRKRGVCVLKRQSIAEDSCFVVAEKEVRKQLLSLIKSYGYKYGKVLFAPASQERPLIARHPEGTIPNDYNFYENSAGEHLIFYKNGTILSYSDQIPYEHIYNLAEFSTLSFPANTNLHFFKAEGKGYVLKINNPNADIKMPETQQYISYVHSDKEMHKQLKKMMQSLSQKLFYNIPCNIIETDTNGEVVIDYSKL